MAVAARRVEGSGGAIHGQFIPIQFERQILPGSFEYAPSYVVDNKIDFTALDGRRENDETGAPAYDPRVMLKIVLYAYSRGMISSREMSAACRENAVMMALSANTRPHFTTIAQLIRELGDATLALFANVLVCCDELGLIGKEMFAIDGRKMSSNASKEWSGTREDFEKRRAKFKEAIEKLVDAKHQVIVAAEAFGKGNDAELLEPMVQQVEETFQALGEEDIYRKAKVLADSGFHTEDSMKMLFEREIDAYVPDKNFRKRDPAFTTAQRHRSFKALPGRTGREKRYFDADGFVLNPANGKLVCPGGKELYVKDRNFWTANGYRGIS